MYMKLKHIIPAALALMAANVLYIAAETVAPAKDLTKDVEGWSDEENPGDGTMRDLGYTVTEDGYEVYNANGLLAWATAANNNSNLNCTLTQDIDLQGQTWSPPYRAYQGTFDGQGHAIRNLTGNGGLICMSSGCIIRNVTLINPQITGYGREAGGIVNDADATITNCHVVGGTIEGGISRVGGIAGVIRNKCHLYACSSTATVSGNSLVGGIAGQSEGCISACYYHNKDDRSLTASFNIVGGIAGIQNWGVVSDCYWSGGAEQGIGHNEGTATNVCRVGGAKCAGWEAAAAAMNTALIEAGYTEYKWVMNTGEDTDSRPLITEKVTE